MRKKLFYLILGGILFSTITVLADALINGNQVLFEVGETEITDTNGNNVVDVQDALGYLFQRCGTSSSDRGGWPASEMRTFVNSDIYDSLPQEVKNGIIGTTVVSGHGSTSGENNFYSTDKLYLLSTAEVWEDADGNTNSGIDYYDTAYFLTRQLDYYKNNGVTTNNYGGAVKKAVGSTSGTLWWLRSAYSDYTNSFFNVYSDGDWIYYRSNISSSVAPAFRIG